MISVVRKTDCLWLPVPLIFAVQVHKIITGGIQKPFKSSRKLIIFTLWHMKLISIGPIDKKAVRIAYGYIQRDYGCTNLSLSPNQSGGFNHVVDFNSAREDIEPTKWTFAQRELMPVDNSPLFSWSSILCDTKFVVEVIWLFVKQTSHWDRRYGIFTDVNLQTVLYELNTYRFLLMCT